MSTNASQSLNRDSPLTDLEELELESHSSKHPRPDNSDTEKPKPKKRKLPPPQTLDISSLPTRVQSPWKLGAHVSGAGGIENTVYNALNIGANAFGLFVKNQLKFTSSPISEESAARFKERLKEHNYSTKYILPHGNYLVNLGNPNSEKRAKSFSCFVDDLERCEALGLELFNIHPGSSVGETTPENSISLIAQAINDAHKVTSSIVILLETMAYSGNALGSKLEHLASIIEQVVDKNRIGVCVDTCHSFSAGYNLKSREGWDAFCEEFDSKIGPQYFRAMHLNDSKTPLGSHQDRHENIGLGSLTLEAFHHILTSPRTQDIPLILETPSPTTKIDDRENIWRKEISVLYQLSTLPASELEGKMEELVGTVKDEVKAKNIGGEDKKKKGTRGKGKKKASQDDAKFEGAGVN